MFGAIFSALFVVPFFLLVGTGQPALVTLAIVVGVTIGHAAMYGPQASFFSELFGARVRYSGASLGYQLASVLAGGLSPMIAAGLLAWAHGAFWAIALYMVALALVTLGSVFLAAETATGREYRRRAGVARVEPQPQMSDNPALLDEPHLLFTHTPD
jgi:MFS family permease